MLSALFPNFLPQRPHSFWIFLGVSISIFLASLGLKTPYMAENIATYWHKENPIALVDLSACSESNLKKLRTDFSKKFPIWHLSSLKDSSFEAPLPINEKIEAFFSLSPKTERNNNLSLLPVIEKFLSQTCSKTSFGTLSDTEQQEINAKSRSLEGNAATISHFLIFAAFCVFLFSLLILARARFSLSLSRLILLSESALSALKISAQTIRSLTLTICLGLFAGLLFSNLFCADFSAHFFQKSFFALFFHSLRQQLVAVAHLSLTPDLLLILVALGLYVILVLFFLWNLHKKLKKRRQARIFLSDNNPFG